MPHALRGGPSRIFFPCFALAALAACPSPPRQANQAPGTRAEPAIVEAWRSLPPQGNACDLATLSFDYGTGGGLRNFYCRALTVFPWSRLVSLAPAPFLSGPHSPAGLKLDDQGEFGHYNPAFVRWAADALIPAAKDGALRAQTQPLYDSQVRVLARTYFRVWRTISRDPGWLEAQRVAYGAELKRGRGGWSSRFTDAYEDVLGSAATRWGGHDPNHVRSATTWWLRRSIDGTAPLWFDGLTRLLQTYDAAWLAVEQGGAPPALPRGTP